MVTRYLNHAEKSIAGYISANELECRNPATILKRLLDQVPDSIQDKTKLVADVELHLKDCSYIAPEILLDKLWKPFETLICHHLGKYNDNVDHPWIKKSTAIWNDQEHTADP